MVPRNSGNERSALVSFIRSVPSFLLAEFDSSMRPSTKNNNSSNNSNNNNNNNNNTCMICWYGLQ